VRPADAGSVEAADVRGAAGNRRRRMAEWFGVRCVFAHPQSTYEERITLWQADSFDEAVAVAEDDAATYADDTGAEFLGFAQAFVMSEEPGHGVEVFCLERESDLDPDEYLDTFFDTGNEREASLDEPV
jgi:hypothetical protein